MRIHCDRCGAEITKEKALVVEADDQVFHFCSADCREEAGYKETHADPATDEDATAP